MRDARFLLAILVETLGWTLVIPLMLLGLVLMMGGAQ